MRPGEQFDLQRTCEHPKAEEHCRTEIIEGDRKVTLRHMFCPRCLMFFAREVWG
jgi:hypothetical protein